MITIQGKCFRFAHPAEATGGVLSCGFVKCWALAFSLGLSRHSSSYQAGPGGSFQRSWEAQIMPLWGHYMSLKCFDTTVSGVWGPCGVAGVPWGSSGTRSRGLDGLLGGPDGA